ncbi:MAG: hypothetical protein HOG04_15240, partial [Nitrospinaceae bacterium]|nr:hypothetical protein [Nitrospinaceae bacterium]
TGNVTGGIFGLALESDAHTFLGTLTRFVQTLDIETLIPAHMPMAEASLLDDYLSYFSEVARGVRGAITDGLSLEQTFERVVQSERFSLPESDPRAAVMTGRHQYNVRRTFMAMSKI